MQRERGTSEFAAFYEREAPGLVRSVTLVIGEPSLAEDAVAVAADDPRLP